MLALYTFDRSYTQPSQDKAGFTYPAVPVDGKTGTVRVSFSFFHILTTRKQNTYSSLKEDQYGHVGMSTVVSGARSQTLVRYRGPGEYSGLVAKS